MRAQAFFETYGGPALVPVVRTAAQWPKPPDSWMFDTSVLAFEPSGAV